MRLQIMSDLHFEHYLDWGKGFVENLLKPADVDAVVLAGDIVEVANIDRITAVFQWFSSRFPQVIYVPGNHEYYGSFFVDVNTRINQAAELFTNVNILRTGVVLEMGNRRIIGDTMWVPFDLKHLAYANNWSDFTQVRGIREHIYKQNTLFRKWVTRVCAPGTVVVTHHAPSMKSVSAKWASSLENMFFVSDMEAIILKKKPRLWIHGHMHERFDYTIGSTRIVCNPRGYPGRPSIKEWDPQFVVEV